MTMRHDGFVRLRRQPRAMASSKSPRERQEAELRERIYELERDCSIPLEELQREAERIAGMEAQS